MQARQSKNDNIALGASSCRWEDPPVGKDYVDNQDPREAYVLQKVPVAVVVTFWSLNIHLQGLNIMGCNVVFLQFGRWATLLQRIDRGKLV